MRILFLTNHYPPHIIGGQEYSCQQMVEGLRKRGHEAVVLTSMHGLDNQPVVEDDVYRWLFLEMDLTPWRHVLVFFTQRRARKRENLKRLQRLMQQFSPDIIFIWGMWNLHHSLPALAEKECPGRVVYRFAEYWPTLPNQHRLYWLEPGRRWYSRFPKWVVRQIALAILALEKQPVALKFEHAICVSRATRQVLVEAGFPLAQARIIYTGLDTRNYPENGRQPDSCSAPGRLRLLYAGRLTPKKGVETAIKALATTIHAGGLDGITLKLAGTGDERYVARLHDLAVKQGVEKAVSFLGLVPAAEMPQLMQQCDILLVPSNWPEPFARVVLEGMLSGLVVVATPCGGTGEIVTDNENGLLFAPDDSDDLAAKISCLAANPAARVRLASAGKRMVQQKFTFDVMLDEVEGYLKEISLAH